MDMRKIELMKELQNEYYKEKEKEKGGLDKVQKEGIVICILLLMIVIGLSLLR